VERIEFTEYAGHAGVLASSCSSGKDIVVAGGDGTLYEVLQHLDLARQRVAILPAGRGNALARDLGAHSLLDAIAAVAQERPIHIDLMEVTLETADGEIRRVRVCSSVGFGYPSRVTRSANNRLRMFNGYSYAAASVIVPPRKREYEIRYDDGAPRSMKLTGILANNTQHVGSFLALPNGNCRDGRFDVIELSAGWIGQLGHNASTLCGLHCYAPARFLAAARAEVRPDTPSELMLDGELVADVVRIQMRILPGALRCVATGTLT
jgi:diacylglycerol kinase family enzyme